MDNVKINEIKKYIIFTVFVLTIGNVYSLPKVNFISIGELLTIVYLIYLFVSNYFFSKGMKLDKMLLVFFVYSLIVILVNVWIYDLNFFEPLKRVIRDFLYYFLIFFVGRQLFEIHTFKKMVKIFCILLSSLIIIQFIVYQVTGFFVPGFFLNLNVSGNDGTELYNHYIYMARITGYLKPNGFLKEPASCGQCLFMGLLLLLHFDKIDRKNLFCAIYITIGSILTFSVNALVFTSFAWISYFFLNNFNKNVTKKKIVSFIIMIIVFIVLFYFVKQFGFDGVLGRLFDSSSSDTLDGSTQYRIYKGFNQFSSLPYLNKFFGIGFGNYTEMYNIGFFDIENEYMNSIAYIFMSCGIVGFTVYVLIFVQNWKRMIRINKVALIGLLLMMFSSSVYSTAVYVWFCNVILFGRGDKGEKQIIE